MGEAGRRIQARSVSRYPRLRPGILLLVALPGISTSSCVGQEAEETAAEVPTLLAAVASRTAEDTVLLLISRQRELFAAMLRHDTSSVIRLLDVRIAGDPAFVTLVPVGPHARPVNVEATPGAGYLALAGGFLPEGLDAVPEEYRVRRIAPEVAVVTTKPNAAGLMLSTSWVLRADGWRATRMDQVAVDSTVTERFGPRR